MDSPPLSRVGALDFLRGVAVLGLPLMNITLMGDIYLDYEPDTSALFSDAVVDICRIVFWDGRFRSLFCLLFGIGLYLQYESFTRKHLDVSRAIKRRMNWLLLFGIVHGVFIWAGDILLSYAICGLVIRRHLHNSAAQLKKRGIIYFITGSVISLIFVLLSIPAESHLAGEEGFYMEAVDAFQFGYGNYVLENLLFVVSLIVLFPFLMLFYLSGVMLIGIGFYKSGELSSGFSPKQLGTLWAITVIALLADMCGYLFVDEWRYHAEGEIACISGLSMALLFWHWVVTRSFANISNVIVTAIKRVGRMALTLYVMQSLIGVIVLRLLFPNWNATFSLLDYTILAAGTSLFQLILAYFYMSAFSHGPLEHVWRKLVNTKKYYSAIST